MKQDVNYIKHQKSVFLKLMEDNRVRTSHLSIYNALFMIWNSCEWDTELSINRNDVMKLSKIGNVNTYTNCLKDLHEFGYIIYNPSYNPLKGSLVTIIRFDKGSDKGTVKGGSKGTDKGSDTLYKLLNSKTIELLNKHYKLINENLQYWIKEDNKIEEDTNNIKTIVEYLNKSGNKNYKHSTDKTKTAINARMNEGFTIDDFKKVIDVKTKQWLEDEEMNKYLRPETLFGTKFESYLNEQTVINKPKRSPEMQAVFDRAEQAKKNLPNYVGNS